MKETDDAAATEKKRHAGTELQYNRGGYILTGNLEHVDGYAPSVHGIAPTVAGSINGGYLGPAWKST